MRRLAPRRGHVAAFLLGGALAASPHVGKAVDLLRIPPVSCHGLQLDLDRVWQELRGSSPSAEAGNGEIGPFPVRAEDLFGVWTGLDHLGRPFVLELGEDYHFTYSLKFGPDLELQGYYAFGERDGTNEYALRFGFERITTARKSMQIFGGNTPKIAPIKSFAYDSMEMMAIRAEVSNGGHDYTFGLSPKVIEYKRDTQHPMCTNILEARKDYESNIYPIVNDFKSAKQTLLDKLTSLVNKLKSKYGVDREKARKNFTEDFLDIWKIDDLSDLKRGEIISRMIQTLFLEYKATLKADDLNGLRADLLRNQDTLLDATEIVKTHEEGIAQCVVLYAQIRHLEYALHCPSG